MSKAPQDEKNSNNAAAKNAPQERPKPTAPLGSSMTDAGPSRIVGNQAKKQEEVTRQGTQKMKFVPTLPIRRKKPDAEIKEEVAASPPKSAERGRGRGRGLGRGRGGPPPPRQEMQMIASGPFAMGPALAGSSKRRAPRSNFAPVMPTGPGSASLGEGLSRSSAPSLSRERDKSNKGADEDEDEDIEVYSDPDEGVQIVDMDAIKTMDWMAPESLKRERDEGKTSKKKKKKKAEAMKNDAKGKEKAMEEDSPEPVVEDEVEKNLANALDLSESEEEEEMEDLIDDFAMEDVDVDEESLTRQEKLYFFQFPQPFPTFTQAAPGEATDVDVMVIDGHKPNVLDKGKKVSFAPDVKPPAPNGEQDKPDAPGGAAKSDATAAKPTEETKIDGVIGQLEVHRSGIIKMRLANGMLMDVTAATQPSFLQHAVFLDPASKKMHILGEVNRRFVVSPDVDKLLEEIDKQDAAEKIKNET